MADTCCLPACQQEVIMRIRQDIDLPNVVNLPPQAARRDKVYCQEHGNIRFKALRNGNVEGFVIEPLVLVRATSEGVFKL